MQRKSKLSRQWLNKYRKILESLAKAVLWPGLLVYSLTNETLNERNFKLLDCFEKTVQKFIAKL